MTLSVDDPGAPSGFPSEFSASGVQERVVGCALRFAGCRRTALEAFALQQLLVAFLVLLEVLLLSAVDVFC